MDGSLINGQTVPKGDYIIKPIDPVKEGYVFQGWYYNGEEYDFNVGLVSNITLTAKWKENQKYTVTFNTRGGSNVATQTVYINNRVVKPSSPTRTNYTFEAWYTTSGKEYNFNTPVTSNLTLYATWDSKYDLEFEFDINGGVRFKNENLPDGYIIKHKKGNVSTEEVISSGSINQSIPDYNIVDLNGLYIVVAMLNNQELVTKKFYVAGSDNRKTWNLSVPVEGIFRTGKAVCYNWYGRSFITSNTVTLVDSKLNVYVECSTPGGSGRTTLLIEVD